MVKNKLMAIMFMLILVFPVSFIGCSSGGDDAPAPRSIIEVLPSSYDFGTVTENNSPAALEVEIQNDGSLALTVSDIFLSDTTNFALDLTGGFNSCDTASSTIPAGSNCTFEVNFTPGSDGPFDAVLTIESDDSTNPTINVPLSGIRETITSLNVRINQVKSTEICPNPVVTAYVSVTDQGGYPVTGLTGNDFSVTEAGVDIGVPTSASFVSNTATLSVALAMDYSSSISNSQDNVDDMEESAVYFVDQLTLNDEAEIIKFANDYDVVQAFTSDKNLLKDAIYAPYPGLQTDLYDAVYQALDDTSARSKDRQAVIVITDGDNDPSIYTLPDVINNANTKGVPIFTVGLGQVNSAILTQMADDTGGQFYQAATSDNLRTIYQQLANVLFNDQYILTYTSGLGAGETANLTIEATEDTSGATGDDTKGVTPCP